MHLSEILVEDFRLFENFSLALNSGLNVIVGENNSGKTALIDAIRLTLDTNSSEWTRISEEDFRQGKTKFKIRLKFDSIKPEQAHVFIEHLTHEASDSGSRKSVLYVNLLASLTDKFQRGYRYIQTELKSGENAEGPQIEREIKNYLSATYLKPLRDAEGELSAGRGSRLAQILIASKKLREGTHFEKLLKAFVAANQSAKSNEGLSDSRNSIKDYFQKLTFDDDKTKFDVLIQMLGSKDFEHMTESEKKNSFRESRPQNLLCMAMHKNNLTEAQLSSLTSNLGWSVASVLPLVQHGT